MTTRAARARRASESNAEKFWDVDWEKWLAVGVRVAILVCCMLPLFVSPSTIYPFSVGKSVFFRTVVDLAFPVWALLAIRNADYRPKPGLVLGLLLAYTGAVVLASVAGINPDRSFWSTYARSQGVVEFLHFVAMAVMAASMFRHWRWREALLWTNVGVGALVMLFGMICYYYFPEWPFVDADKRLHSTLGQPTFFSAYCTFIILMSLVAWSGMRGWMRLHWRAVVALGLLLLILSCVWGIWLAAGRTTVLSLVLVALFCGGALIWYSRSRLAKMLGVAGVGLGVLVVVGVVALMLTDRLTVDEDEQENLLNRFSRSLTERDNSAKGRWAAIVTGVEAYKDRPVLGWGPELFDYGWVKHVTVEQHNGRIFDQSHNRMIEVAATTGSVGMLTYLMLLAAVALVFYRLILRERDRNLARSVFTAALLLNFVVVSMFLFDTTTFVLALAVTLTLAMLCEYDQPMAMPERLRGRLRLPALLSLTGALRRLADRIGSTRGLRGVIVPAAVVALTGCAVVSILFTARIQQASEFKPVQGRPMKTLANYARTVESFPAMSAQQRIDFTLMLMPYIPRMRHDDKQRVLPYMVRQIEEAVEADPHYWRMHYVAAVFYDWIAAERDDFPDLSRYHHGRLAELSPHSFYTEDAAKVVREPGPELRPRTAGPMGE